MIVIFHELNAEICQATKGLPIATQRSDYNEIEVSVPTRTRTLWVLIAAAWSRFSEVLGESEFGFPSDY